MKKSMLLLMAFVCLVQINSLAQDHPFRIGTKVGLPNLAGMNLEYVTPALDGKLGVSVDGSYIPISIGRAAHGLLVDDLRVAISYFELGANYYFFKSGRGLYGSASVGRLSVAATYKGMESSFDPSLVDGKAKASVSVTMMNLKIGAKLGKTFYFRPEIGYGISSGLPQTIRADVRYPDGTTETETTDLPGSGLFNGSVIFNIGFGFAF